MRTTINIEQIIGMAFVAEFIVFGFMALALSPYGDCGTAQRTGKGISCRRYLRARRLLGVTYILLAIAALPGLHTAAGGTGAVAGGWLTGAGWQFNLVPACLTLFFVAHVRMLLGLCGWAPTKRLAHLLRLLPLPVLCAVYAVHPAWGEAVAVLQSVHLALLVGYYTPLFYREHAWLDSNCWDAVNRTSEESAPRYDCLPESMPWVERRYTALLVITLLALPAHFLPYHRTDCIVALLIIGYVFWFFYWVFLRFPRFARSLFHFMDGDE